MGLPQVLVETCALFGGEGVVVAGAALVPREVDGEAQAYELLWDRARHLLAPIPEHLEQAIPANGVFAVDDVAVQHARLAVAVKKILCLFQQRLACELLDGGIVGDEEGCLKGFFVTGFLGGVLDDDDFGGAWRGGVRSDFLRQRLQCLLVIGNDGDKAIAAGGNASQEHQEHNYWHGRLL
jgi:hypothetical protein